MRKARTPRLYSKAELAFLRKHRSMIRHRLLALFVAAFDRPGVTIFHLKDIMYRKGWCGEVTHKFSKAELAYLKQHKDMKRRDLHSLFIKRFGRTDITYLGIKSVLQRHGFLTGRAHQEPERPIGFERLSKNGFVSIKTGVGNHSRNYSQKNRFLWERQNGPIPAGHKLKCLDGNKLNCDPSNWACVPNGVIARLNKRHFDNAPPELKPTIIAVSKLEHLAASEER